MKYNNYVPKELRKKRLKEVINLGSQYKKEEAIELVYYSKVSLIDINLPEKILKKFYGPRFGIEGIRKITEIPFPYPIIGTIIKPCAGLTEKEVAEKCYLAAKGF